jgi:hypothetical protein
MLLCVMQIWFVTTASTLSAYLCPLSITQRNTRSGTTTTLVFLLLSVEFHFPNGATAPSGPGPPDYRGFTITLRHTTVGRTPLDEWSARRRDTYLTTHNTHNTEASMPPVRFEPAIPASKTPQTHALDRAANTVGGIRKFNSCTHIAKKHGHLQGWRRVVQCQITNFEEPTASIFRAQDVDCSSRKYIST